MPPCARAPGERSGKQVPSIVILPRAEAQIVDVLGHTLDTFGDSKYVEYRDLIEQALTTLPRHPRRGSAGRTSTRTRGLFTSLARADGRAICFCIGFAAGSKSPGFSTTRWTYLGSNRENGNERSIDDDGRRQRKRSPRGCGRARRGEVIGAPASQPRAAALTGHHTIEDCLAWYAIVGARRQDGGNGNLTWDISSQAVFGSAVRRRLPRGGLVPGGVCSRRDPRV
jgi:plasmid stabilization system protein ParE